MDIQEHFEPIFKMSHLPSSDASALPFPVKFRQIFDDQDIFENGASLQDDSNDLESMNIETTLTAELDGKFLLKNPLNLPNQFLTGKKTSSTTKTGKSMRSSNELEDNIDCKKLYKVIAEGNRILNLQKEQHLQLHKQTMIEQTATVLVNDLLKNGFHITPPESTPRFVDESWTEPPSTKVTEDDFIKHAVGNKLIVAVHKELKRLQSNNIDIS